MNKYLKSYQIVMHTVGPVFVGSGREIGKKEYVFINRRKIGVTNIQLLYQELKKRKKEEKKVHTYTSSKKILLLRVGA